MANDKRPASFHSLREIGSNTYLITFHADDDAALDYEPGHVISFDCDDRDGNTLHHPYTVIENDADKRLFSFVFRHIPDGKMTSYLITMQDGDKATFSGKFHEPIADEIADGAQAFIGIATGSGIGPLYGYIKQALADSSIPITLYVGYKTPEDVCLADELNELANKHEHFTWQASVSEPDGSWSGLTGRITHAIADDLDNIEQAHFHLVGNGSMINEMREALYQAGVPKEQVSKESFFNHGVKADGETVEKLVKALTN